MEELDNLKIKYPLGNLRGKITDELFSFGTSRDSDIKAVRTVATYINVNAFELWYTIQDLQHIMEDPNEPEKHMVCELFYNSMRNNEYDEEIIERRLKIADDHFDLLLVLIK